MNYKEINGTSKLYQKETKLSGGVFLDDIDHNIDGNFTIEAQFDSHVHWLMTGEVRSFLDLSKHTSFDEFNKNISLEPKNYRDSWLMGYGWAGNFFKNVPARNCLDKISVSQPICFIKEDGHSAALNTNALNQLIAKLKNLDLDHFSKDSNGDFDGIVSESSFYQIYTIIPPINERLMTQYLLEAQNVFLNKGYSHIRDLTCNTKQFELALELEKNNRLKLFVDCNFNSDTLEQLKLNLDYLNKIKCENQNFFDLKCPGKLKIQGAKIFYDGSLGSRTALLSEAYKDTHKFGLKQWNEDDLKMAMSLTWKNNLEFSVHTLGDQAVADVIRVANQLYAQKNRGKLNLEHTQILYPDNIRQMKGLFVRCHLQPSHWLSDKKFIKNILSNNAYKHSFPWIALEKAKVDFSFGSDSPIAKSDYCQIVDAVSELSKIQKSRLKKPIINYSQHYSRHGAKTVWSNFKPRVIKFDDGTDWHCFKEE